MKSYTIFAIAIVVVVSPFAMFSALPSFNNNVHLNSTANPNPSLTNNSLNWLWNNYSLPGYAPYSNLMFSGAGLREQSPVSSWNNSAVFYVNSSACFGEYFLQNKTWHGIAHVSLFQEDIAFYNMIYNLFSIEGSNSLITHRETAFFWGYNSSNQNITFETVNTQSGKVTTLNWAPYSSAVYYGAQADYLGHNFVAFIESGEMYVINLTTGQNVSMVSLPFFEANNMFWIPQFGIYVNVAAGGLVGSSVQILHVNTMDGKIGSSQIISIPGAQFDNGVPDIMVNSTSGEIWFQEQSGGNSNFRLDVFLKYDFSNDTVSYLHDYGNYANTWATENGVNRAVLTTSPFILGGMDVGTGGMNEIAVNPFTNFSIQASPSQQWIIQVANGYQGVYTGLTLDQFYEWNQNTNVLSYFYQSPTQKFYQNYEEEGSLPLYNIKIAESGLPAGTTWSININNTIFSSSSSAILNIWLPNGTYNYTISGKISNYLPDFKTGNVKVDGSTAVIGVVYFTYSGSQGGGSNFNSGNISVNQLNNLEYGAAIAGVVSIATIFILRRKNLL